VILWFKHLPHRSMNFSEWTPFIQNDWFRKHYMKFVYLLMLLFVLTPIWLKGSLDFIEDIPLLPIFILIFILHEILHIMVVYTKGDISLTFKGVYFWLHTDAELSKTRFWVFMSLPLIGLSIIPGVAAFFVPGGTVQSLLFSISWINLIISSSDVINSILILFKPRRAVFCRGYYQVER